MKFLRYLAATLLITSNMTNAAYTHSKESTITYLSVYSRSSAPGDVFIRLSDPAPECVGGYYVLDTSPGKAEILSFALSAYHANKKILINAFDEPNWRGSPSNNSTCEIEGIRFAEYE
ncbi:hypothetical protein L1D13_17885 [Vibrio tubiashii]|uniref:hypothetical protein n=1 Tax=Vibrio tubiashii TaxID=29498 RepID=UPI001EFD7FA5|nr:hypothetical protein [Vibrio tubiashii]MCG9580568.1 hypothetical protein [Vibrio tubiashii]MCG9614159.1 hypothetical protein [Vibrio tubiashii]MCG9688777.1 hypothetical protein [Vibrio tubiashii]